MRHGQVWHTATDGLTESRPQRSRLSPPGRHASAGRGWSSSPRSWRSRRPSAAPTSSASSCHRSSDTSPTGHGLGQASAGGLVPVGQVGHGARAQGVDLVLAEADRSSHRLVRPALEGAVPCRGHREDGDLPGAGGQGAFVTQGGPYALEGGTEARAQEEGVERAVQPPVLAGQREVLRTGGTGALRDGVIEAPGLGSEPGGRQGFEPAHVRAMTFAVRSSTRVVSSARLSGSPFVTVARCPTPPGEPPRRRAAATRGSRWRRARPCRSRRSRARRGSPGTARRHWRRPRPACG